MGVEGPGIGVEGGASKEGYAGPLELGDLARASCFHGPVHVGGEDGAELRELLYRMKLIRQTEEIIGDMVSSGEVRCPCHLAIGQEACAVGVAAALDPDRDAVFGAHRSHGHYLAMGGPLEALLAEILGRDTGCSRGMGGSMHLIAPEKGVLGTVPIVGATVPIAVGAALAASQKGRSGVAVSFFGDGATEEGVVQESLNFAAAHGLPVLFACENNLFASHLHIRLRQKGSRVARFAEAHGIPSETVDGNDVVSVLRASRAAVGRARSRGGPAFLEMVTYRWRGHVGHREDLDVGVQRSGDLPEWKGRDPVGRLAAGMTEAGMITPEELRRMDEEVRVTVLDALSAARAASFPDPSATRRYMFAGAS